MQVTLQRLLWTRGELSRHRLWSMPLDADSPPLGIRYLDSDEDKSSPSQLLLCTASGIVYVIETSQLAVFLQLRLVSCRVVWFVACLLSGFILVVLSAFSSSFCLYCFWSCSPRHHHRYHPPSYYGLQQPSLCLLGRETSKC